eukprot:6180891-Pleurochrysis_carterae.AAC.1
MPTLRKRFVSRVGCEQALSSRSAFRCAVGIPKAQCEPFRTHSFYGRHSSSKCRDPVAEILPALPPRFQRAAAARCVLSSVDTRMPKSPKHGADVRYVIVITPRTRI